MFVRLDDPEDVRLETVGRPVVPTTRCGCWTKTISEVPAGR